MIKKVAMSFTISMIILIRAAVGAKSLKKYKNFSHISSTAIEDNTLFLYVSTLVRSITKYEKLIKREAISNQFQKALIYSHLSDMICLISIIRK